MQTFPSSPYLFSLSLSCCFQSYLFQRINLRSSTSVEEAIWDCNFILLYYILLNFKTNIKSIYWHSCTISLGMTYYTGKVIRISFFSSKSWAPWGLIEARTEQHTKLGIQIMSCFMNTKLSKNVTKSHWASVRI